MNGWGDPVDIGLSAAGLGVGILVGATGVGGGSIMTPLLIGAFGVPPLIAIGTDVVFAATIKLFGVLIHGRFGTIDWRLVGWIAMGSLPAALLALLIIASVDPQTAVTVLSPILGIVLIATALSMLFMAKRPNDSRANSELASKTALAPGLMPRVKLVSLGAVLGALVAWTSVGAGALGAAFLRWMIPSLSSARLVGTDLGHALVLSVLVGAGHWELGNVDYDLLLSLVLGALPGVAIGSVLAVKLPEVAVRRVLAGTLGVVGIKWLIGT